VWSAKRLASLGLFRSFDLAPDGKRVAALMPVETADVQLAKNHVIFLENFFDELRRRSNPYWSQQEGSARATRVGARTGGLRPSA
jgi:hypothetical protein